MIKSVYTDGSTAYKNPSPWGIAWAFCAVNGADQELFADVGKVTTNDCKGYKASNNLAEMLAAVRALEYLVENIAYLEKPVIIYLDSELTLNRIFHGYSNKLVPKNVVRRLEAALVTLHNKQVDLRSSLLAGHPTKKDLALGYKIKKGRQLPVSKWNVRVDKLASEAAARLVPVSVLSGKVN